MPKRTNFHQAIVYFVKKQTAGDEATVTESKLLLDSSTGELREVDVVIEGAIGDDVVTISIEVTSGARPATVEWVEREISKHQQMPTNSLLLVSWSGFTPQAIKKAQAQGGRVQTLTPEVIQSARVPDLYIDSFGATPERFTLLLRDPDGSESRGDDFLSTANIYSGPTHDDYLCTLQDLTQRVINANSDSIEIIAHAREDKSEISHFSIEHNDLEKIGLYILRSDTEEWYRIQGLYTSGPFHLVQVKTDFTVMRLGTTNFAMTKVLLGGQPAVFVLTANPDNKSSTVSWRLV